MRYLTIVVLLAVLVAVGCASPSVRSEQPALALLQSTSTEARLATLRSELAVLEATKAEAARETAERPLRDMLSWAQWAGGALSVLGVIALGLTFSPWGSWIPGGRTTALCGVGTGVGVIFLARSIGTALDVAWLPLALLVAGVAVACGWVAWLTIRETAAHADRVAPATTPDAIKAAGDASALAQTQKGVRWLINAVRPRKLPLTSPNNRGSDHA